MTILIGFVVDGKLVFLVSAAPYCHGFVENMVDGHPMRGWMSFFEVTFIFDSCRVFRAMWP
jgi:hypothetical protein